MKKAHGDKMEAIAMYSSEGEHVEFGSPVLLEGTIPHNLHTSCCDPKLQGKATHLYSSSVMRDTVPVVLCS